MQPLWLRLVASFKHKLARLLGIGLGFGFGLPLSRISALDLRLVPRLPGPMDRSGRYLTSRRMERFVFSEPPKILKHGNPMHPYGHPPNSKGVRRQIASAIPAPSTFP